MLGPVSSDAWIAAVVAASTLVGVAFGRLPFVPLDRAGFALVGAAALVAVGVVDLETAAHLIDADVVALVLGLLLLNEALAEVGFFRRLTALVTRRAATPFGLLVLLVVSAGVTSALFLNDTIALMLTPVVVQVTRGLGLRPLPYLLALALAANVGSVATVTGNPQNLIVAVAGGIDYLAFAAALAPVAAAGLVVVIVVVAIAFRGDVLGGRFARRPAVEVGEHGARATPVVAVAFGMLVAFVLGAPVAVSALVAGALSLLLVGGAGPTLLRRVDWSLLTLFAGLFVVVGALRETGVADLVVAALGDLLTAGTLSLTLVTAAASNLLSNVPAVMLLVPLVQAVDGTREALLSVAMASTLAGNLTLVGSIANLIVAERARQLGVDVGFWAYLRVGVPVTLLSGALGVWWLAA